MKLFLFILLIFTLEAKSQIVDDHPWSPPGATWVYTISPSFGSLRFLQHRYIKDTMYFGRMAKQMEVSNINFYGIPATQRSQTISGYSYYNLSNDSVYYFASGEYRFIYSFNPSIGDEWIVGNEEIKCASPGYDPYDTLTVHTIKQDTIGNRIFTGFYADDYTSKRVMLGMIYKNIGSAMSPYPLAFGASCTITDDVGKPENLVCYSDNLRGSVAFTNTSSISCHGIITSLLAEPGLSSIKFSVFPNPARDLITIKNIIGKFEYMIVDAQGKTHLSGQHTGAQINIM